jgi:uncharacterized protein (UPF0218 family)
MLITGAIIVGFIVIGLIIAVKISFWIIDFCTLCDTRSHRESVVDEILTHYSEVLSLDRSATDARAEMLKAVTEAVRDKKR